ncbi:hypothetical protein [Nocardioides antri]|uniref:hypothetical protein n=1 Tax=Nocardioides antri TaxID=2607659 RepID=UPI00165F47B9|nr:hypothetical protein [Nocardioides antri]
MREFGRRAALVVVATVAMVGLSAVVTPSAQALDSAWGCGGACRVAPGHGN